LKDIEYYKNSEPIIPYLEEGYNQAESSSEYEEQPRKLTTADEESSCIESLCSEADINKVIF
jgi:succinate dehydrogenase/fumarate reductase-like Fe-S protein